MGAFEGREASAFLDLDLSWMSSITVRLLLGKLRSAFGAKRNSPWITSAAYDLKKFCGKKLSAWSGRAVATNRRPMV
jgi:hypothetical protein